RGQRACALLRRGKRCVRTAPGHPRRTSEGQARYAQGADGHAAAARHAPPPTPVAGTPHGTRTIEPMLKITRVWNSVCACAFMRRGLALAADYARRRTAFWERLS